MEDVLLNMLREIEEDTKGFSVRYNNDKRKRKAKKIAAKKRRKEKQKDRKWRSKEKKVERKWRSMEKQKDRKWRSKEKQKDRNWDMTKSLMVAATAIVVGSVVKELPQGTADLVKLARDAKIV